MALNERPDDRTLAFQPTCDVFDKLGHDIARVPDVAWINYGGVPTCHGVVAATVQCHHDNSWVKQLLEADPGPPTMRTSTQQLAPILVVDGGASRHCALLGDGIATAAVQHGWRGVLIHGSVRDVNVLRTLPLCIQAMGATPRKSYRGTVPNTGTCNETVYIGTNRTPVSVGDVVFVDHDGVVFVSPEHCNLL